MSVFKKPKIILLDNGRRLEQDPETRRWFCYEKSKENESEEQQEIIFAYREESKQT